MSAEAATYYVATTGFDSNAGSISQPFRTIHKGVSVLAAGDTLYVRAGTYNEWFNSGIPGGTSWSAPVTIRSYPGETVTIRPDAGADRVFTFWGSSTQYIVIDGFIMDAVNVSYDGVRISDEGTGYAHHIRIQNSEIKNARGNGVMVSGPTGGNEFLNLHVHHNATYNFNPYGHGFYVTGSNNLIEGCEIHDQSYGNFSVGIHIYNSGSTNVSNNILRRNKIYNHSRAAGILLSSGSGNMAYNNLAWNNYGGIAVDYGSAGSKVYNNTLYGNVNFGVSIGSSAADTEVRNNIAYSTGVGVADAGARTIQTNNLTQDPMFRDSANRDFSLQSGSPAIDRGLTLSAVGTDFDGKARPSGIAYDIGAYEFGASTTTSLAPPQNLRIVP